MKVSVEELRVAFNRLVEHLEATGQETFEIDDDFYWDVPCEVRYDSYEVIEGATLGQLSDDWNGVQSMLDGRRPPLGHGLVWLSSVLRRVGEKAVE
jgi:hypothetical protein